MKKQCDTCHHEEVCKLKSSYILVLDELQKMMRDRGFDKANPGFILSLKCDKDFSYLPNFREPLSSNIPKYYDESTTVELPSLVFGKETADQIIRDLRDFADNHPTVSVATYNAIIITCSDRPRSYMKNGKDILSIFPYSPHLFGWTSDEIKQVRNAQQLSQYKWSEPLWSVHLPPAHPIAF